MSSSPETVAPHNHGRMHWPGVVHELDPQLTPFQALRRLQSLDRSLLLHSSQKLFSTGGAPDLGRFSFLVAEPFAWIESDHSNFSTLVNLREQLSRYNEAPIDGLPPFQGGAAGFLAYDFNRALEQIPPARHYDFQLPNVAFGIYDVVIAWDHKTGKTWLISHGYPETDHGARRTRAQARATRFLAQLQSDNEPQTESQAAREQQTCFDPYSPFPLEEFPGASSNLSASEYREMVSRAIEYIYAGDVYQVNLAQRLLFPARSESIELYAHLVEVNPAPFAAWFDLGDTQIVSCSPERLVTLRGRQVETRPIKGTRRRTGHPQVDLARTAELLASEKDRAENVMIVDLLRNDLSRVCTDDSVRVSQLCDVEAYASVLHLVSAVEGELQPGFDAIDVLAAMFPGGSITGAPKIRAMEIISELEPTTRGAYCGSLGYIGFDGSADFNILIRTITASNGWWQIQVGGGIVAQSDIDLEYEETWTKAWAMLRAVRR
ncbi:MAG TPA: aminodeoxychorismate synthase component I [Pirellulaceae bacterium]|nr:aminodeoxychorismate synthase component I [Pirellulaceae bacterium]HMO91709.1 aminodeoxychorismate synthase component I [Pirellulaceae bacterium]HMP68405.1 aminodeoxychorismate synthase component I [Pirellulaceae bacterium]